MAAGAVGGDRSGVDLGPAVVGAAVGGDIGPRVSTLVGGSVASSRRIRNSNGGCEGPARSAFGPVGGCIGGRAAAGSAVVVVGDVGGPDGGALLSFGCDFSEAWAETCAVTEPNAGTCGADGGGEERFTGVVVAASLGGSGRGGRDSGRSVEVVVVEVVVVVSRRVSGIDDGLRDGSAAGC